MSLYITSKALKAPLCFFTEGALGRFTLIKPSFCQKIHSIAMIVLCILPMTLSIPLWIFGEVIEIFSKEGKIFFDDSVDLGDGERFLDPKKTQMIGTGVSTFQTTSDKDFCSGTCVHDALKHLRLGGGVDILTKEGRELTIEYLKQMGANTFRFSVEWADVKVNGFNRYIQAASHFRSEGFNLVITLDHWVGNGEVDLFEKPGDEDSFVAYAKDAYLALRPYASYFLTFNEINVDAAQKYVMGVLPPKQILNFNAANRLVSLKLSAHRKVYDALYELEKSNTELKAPGNLQIGLSHQAICMKAQSRWNLIARIVAFVMSYLFHESFVQKIKKMEDKFDFLGLQYYVRPLAGRVGFMVVDSIANVNEHNPHAWMVDGMRYRFDPQGILPILTQVASIIANKPILVTEIGNAGGDNTRKLSYYQTAIKAMRAAQDQGIPLIGALFWTLFPNLEWQHGYKRATNFGILDRNRDTNEVTTTNTFGFLKQVCEQSLSFYQEQAVSQ
jgi:beta-glucosidase/6-phospho-beta-glucosidase/beta-galactosidase